MQLIILYAMNRVPGEFLRLRVSQENEEIGIDRSEMHEYAYDYLFLKTELESQECRLEEERAGIPLQNVANGDGD